MPLHASFQRFLRVPTAFWVETTQGILVDLTGNLGGSERFLDGSDGMGMISPVDHFISHSYCFTRRPIVFSI
jgi:hypothetical protein